MRQKSGKYNRVEKSEIEEESYVDTQSKQCLFSGIAS